jgi:hypothetical protein
MAKIQKPFSFDHILTRKEVHKLTIANVTVACVTVSGLGYNNFHYPLSDVDNRYTFDIDFIHKGSEDIKEILEETTWWDEICEAVHRHVACLFNDQIMEEAA